MENPSFEAKPNTIKSEHLMEGVASIVACIGTEEQYEVDLNKFKLHGKDVNYYAIGDSKDKEYLSSEYQGYVISNIDSGSKFTEHLYDCTSVIAVGIDSETGENISFLTHQDSTRIKGESFQRDLQKRLISLKNKCKEKTVDIVIAGGQNDPSRINTMYYPGSLDVLSYVIKTVYDFEPTVICGPKEAGENQYDNVYFDTKNRRLFIVRPKDKGTYNDSFLPGDLEDINEKWKSAE